MEKSNLSPILMAGIFLILAVSLILVITDVASTKTTLVTYTDTVNLAPLRGVGGEFNYTLAESNKLYSGAILSKPAGTNWRTDTSDCAITSIIMKNSSGATASNADDYTWVTDGNGIQGWLRVKNSTFGATIGASKSNTSTITYQSCPDEYINLGWGRSILNMIGGFFALIILAGVLYYFYMIYKGLQ